MKGFLAPKECDPRIAGWTAPHYLCRNERVADSGLLCLILPGTGGLPRDYRKLADQAADLGFHALALRYPNDVSVNELADGDLSRHDALRRVVLDGEAREGMDAMAPGECLLDRLRAALVHAASARPAENWGQFLSDGAIAWERVAAVGHSLGGGYAALLAKDHLLERVLMLGWADWDRSAGGLADWIAGEWATPPERRFHLRHRRDELVPESVAKSVADLLCVPGPDMEVESSEPPYQHARKLVTDLDPAREFPTASPFHNSLAVDVEVPRFWDGAPMLSDVWTWMLLGR